MNLDPQVLSLVLVLVPSFLAWDVLRRFAQSASQPDPDTDPHLADLQGHLDEVAARVEILHERVATQGITLNKLGLGKLGAKP